MRPFRLPEQQSMLSMKLATEYNTQLKQISSLNKTNIFWENLNVLVFVFFSQSDQALNYGVALFSNENN